MKGEEQPRRASVVMPETNSNFLTYLTLIMFALGGKLDVIARNA